MRRALVGTFILDSFTRLQLDVGWGCGHLKARLGQTSRPAHSYGWLAKDDNGWLRAQLDLSPELFTGGLSRRWS